MRIIPTALLSFLLFTAQSVALTCEAFNPAQTFNFRHAKQETYIVAYGMLNYLSETQYNEPQLIQAHFSGDKISARSMQTVVALPVKVQVSCIDANCGSIPPEMHNGLVYLKKTYSGYELESGPCGVDFFTEVQAGDVKKIQSCMKRGYCSESAIVEFD